MERNTVGSPMRGDGCNDDKRNSGEFEKTTDIGVTGDSDGNGVSEFALDDFSVLTVRFCE
jgi:hypothetical protein